MASYVTGYDDERFEHAVSQSFHCIICTNVFKDPVMCRYNEHLFCRSCITIHLMNSQTCPTCMDTLTVDTLTQAPRGIRNILSELKIRCEFFERGCETFVELGNLERHVADCGYAPAVCSACQLGVNKRDLVHHESSMCEVRRLKCPSCNELRQDMDIVKFNVAAINKKLHNHEKILGRNEMNMKVMEENLVAKVDLLQEQLEQLEVDNHHIQVEMKKSLKQVTEQLEKMTHEVKDEHTENMIAEADGIGEELKVVVAGGENIGVEINSVEVFSLSTQLWTQLQQMRKCRGGLCSVVFNNQVILVGGLVNSGTTNSMERLSTNAVRNDQSITWKKFTAKLPRQLEGHCAVVYNEELIVIGGYDSETGAYSDSITEVSLVPPYTTKLLATMPQTRCYHGIAIFGDKIVIVGGSETAACISPLSSVVMYDITKNECTELAPLPYPVCEIATVKWGDDNLIIIGGADSEYNPLNKVLIYNVKTQKSHMLPDMKYKRQGCVAAVVSDTVIVMGGGDESDNYLKSVESFRFDRYSWEDLPDMHEARCWATAVTC